MILSPKTSRRSEWLDALDDLMIRWGLWINLAWITGFLLLMALVLSGCGRDHSQAKQWKAEQKAACEAKGGVFSEGTIGDAAWKCILPKGE